MMLDMIFINAYIPTYVLPEKQQYADAVSVKDEKVYEVGNRDYVLQDAEKAKKIFDCRGMTLLPGFTDSHVHLIDTGMEMALWVDLSPARTLDDVFSILLEHKAEKHNWITASGFDQAKLKEGRYPTCTELDNLGLKNPVFIRRRDGHSSCLNSEAFRLLERKFRGFHGIEEDSRGKPTGTLRGNAHYAASEKVIEMNFSKQLCKDAAFCASNYALSQGVTTIHSLMGGMVNPAETVRYFMEFQHELPVRTVLWNQSAQVQEILEQGLNRMGGCIMLDGAVGSHSAAMFEPYSDAPHTAGILYKTQEETNQLILEAHQAGLQIAIHAIGDKAIEQALKAFEVTLKKYPRGDHRHRIEHFLAPLPEHIQKAAELGLYISTQPAFEYFWGGAENLYGQRLGPERVLRTHPLKSSVDLGIPVCGGSDSFVTPINPLLGIHAAVHHPNPAQRVSVEEACKMFTVNPPASVFEEKFKGLLSPGFLADFVILGARLKENTKNIKDIPIVSTIVGGKLAYENPSHPL